MACARPLADKAQDWTAYRYGFNNPMRFTDPTGMFEAGMMRTGRNASIQERSEGKDTENTDGGGDDYFGEGGHFDRVTQWGEYMTDKSNGSNKTSGGNQSGNEPPEDEMGDYYITRAGEKVSIWTGELIGKKKEEGSKDVTLDEIVAAESTLINTIAFVQNSKAGEWLRNGKNITKFSKTLLYSLGRVTGGVSIVSSYYDVFKNPSTGNLLKAGANTGLFFFRMNPVVGITMGMLDWFFILYCHSFFS